MLAPAEKEAAAGASLPISASAAAPSSSVPQKHGIYSGTVELTQQGSPLSPSDVVNSSRI